MCLETLGRKGDILVQSSRIERRQNAFVCSTVSNCGIWERIILSSILAMTCIVTQRTRNVSTVCVVRSSPTHQTLVRQKIAMFRVELPAEHDFWSRTKGTGFISVDTDELIPKCHGGSPNYKAFPCVRMR